MKTKLLKHIFMKIKDNYKRFLSLICMAFLVVVFYAGIQSSSPDMLKTLDNFYDENNVYDISVISNVGLTEDDLLKLSKIKNVELAINIQEKDTYLEIEENNYVVKLIEYNSQMNNVYIKEGRLPKNNNEVSVDNALLENNNLKLGDSITIDGKKYSIVGNVISPLYFSTERPSTNLGSGKVDYYIYVYNGSLDLEAYSNIYITVKGTKKYLTNSDSYKKLINNVKKDIDLIKDKQQDIRYDELYSDIIETSEMYGISIDESNFIKPKWYIYDRLDNTSYKELMKKQYKDLTYTIKEELIDGNNATVTVEIEVYDYNKAINDAETYYKNNPSEFKNSDGGIDEEKYMDYKIKKMEAVKDKIKYTLNLTLTKKDKKYSL